MGSSTPCETGSSGASTGSRTPDASQPATTRLRPASSASYSSQASASGYATLSTRPRLRGIVLDGPNAGATHLTLLAVEQHPVLLARGHACFERWGIIGISA